MNRAIQDLFRGLPEHSPTKSRRGNGFQRIVRVRDVQRHVGARDGAGGDWRWQSIRDVQTRLEHPLFPCLFAKKSHDRGSQWLTFLESTEPAELEHLRLALHEFVAWIGTTDRQHDFLNPLLVLVRPSKTPLTLREYHAQAWSMLQYLHDHDERPWPANVPKDPDHHLWSFSFSGMQLFVNISAPAQRERKSRNLGRSLCLVINPRENFDVVAGNNERGRRVRQMIRERIARYEGQPAPAELGTYGDPRNREWLQYAAAEPESPLPSRCPFRARKTADDDEAEREPKSRA